MCVYIHIYVFNIIYFILVTHRRTIVFFFFCFCFSLFLIYINFLLPPRCYSMIIVTFSFPRICMFVWIKFAESKCLQHVLFISEKLIAGAGSFSLKYLIRLRVRSPLPVVVPVTHTPVTATSLTSLIFYQLIINKNISLRNLLLFYAQYYTCTADIFSPFTIAFRFRSLVFARANFEPRKIQRQRIFLLAKLNRHLFRDTLEFFDIRASRSSEYGIFEAFTGLGMFIVGYNLRFNFHRIEPSIFATISNVSFDFSFILTWCDYETKILCTT